MIRDSKLRDRLYRIAKDVVADRRRTAMLSLCELAGMPPLEIGPRRRMEAVPRQAGKGLLQPRRLLLEALQGEVIDESALAAFRIANPLCCIKGCGRTSVAHHIIERSEIRIDVAWNLLNLCDFGPADGHHQGPQGWHQLGALQFVNEYADKLSTAIIKKIMAALAQGKAMKKGTQRLPSAESQTPLEA